MNSQDLRNLQEAYIKVVMNELDESRGDDLRTKHRLKPGEVSKRLSHRADTKTFKYERSDPKRDALSDISRFAGARAQGDSNLYRSGAGERRIRRGGRPFGNTIHSDPDRDRGNKGERFADFVQGKRDSPNMSDNERAFAHFGRTSRYKKEEYDLYDIILSHLLDEGYGETPEAAEAIMVNMSEEWRDSIIG